MESSSAMWDKVSQRDPSQPVPASPPNRLHTRSTKSSHTPATDESEPRHNLDDVGHCLKMKKKSQVIHHIASTFTLDSDCGWEHGAFWTFRVPRSSHTWMVDKMPFTCGWKWMNPTKMKHGVSPTVLTILLPSNLLYIDLTWEYLWIVLA